MWADFRTGQSPAGRDYRPAVTLSMSKGLARRLFSPKQLVETSLMWVHSAMEMLLAILPVTREMLERKFDWIVNGLMREKEQQ